MGLESKFGLHGSCGVINLHGIPGVMGALGGAISAFVATEDKYGVKLTAIWGARANNGRSAGEQGAYQLAPSPMFSDDHDIWHIEGEDEAEEGGPVGKV